VHTLHWFSSLVCGDSSSWDLHLVVWRKFHFCCGTAVSSICLTYNIAFSFIYIHIYIHTCMLGVSEKDTTQHGCVCYCSFDFVVEVKVSCIFIERNKSFLYAYHFIRTCCVLHIYLTIAVDNGQYLPKLLRHRVHGAT
jgi:hypothetical protein